MDARREGEAEASQCIGTRPLRLAGDLYGSAGNGVAGLFIPYNAFHFYAGRRSHRQFARLQVQFVSGQKIGQHDFFLIPLLQQVVDVRAVHIGFPQDHDPVLPCPDADQPVGRQGGLQRIEEGLSGVLVVDLIIRQYVGIVVKFDRIARFQVNEHLNERGLPVIAGNGQIEDFLAVAQGGQQQPGG